MIGNLQRFVGVGDDSIWTIWTCCVTCLGHLAALCHLVGRTESILRGSMDDLCDLVLERLGDISREVHIEQHSQFDVLTGVCISVVLLWPRKALTANVEQISWARALDTIDVRIRSCSHTESQPLRCWRGIIGQAYTELQANMPVYEPCQLVKMVLTVDGRTGDSTAPNFLRCEERVPYGL